MRQHHVRRRRKRACGGTADRGGRRDRHLISDDSKALALFREHTTGEKHVHKNGDSDNITI
jgi:hypothetical protein